MPLAIRSARVKQRQVEDADATNDITLRQPSRHDSAVLQPNLSPSIYSSAKIEALQLGEELRDLVHLLTARQLGFATD
jgi:hypothetical protein